MPFGTEAAVEDGHAPGQFTAGFDVARHPLPLEQVRIQDSQQGRRVVERNQFSPQFLMRRPKRVAQQPVQQGAGSRLGIG